MPRLSSTLTLSTVHLTEEVAAAWDAAANSASADTWQSKFTQGATEYGFFIYVPGLPMHDMPDRADLLPPCLKDAVRLARTYGAEYLVFDRDEDVLEDELPTYDW